MAFGTAKRQGVVVLGATGMVGQRMLHMLHCHPSLEVVALCASDRSAGRRYGDACRWLMPGEPYAGLAHLEVLPCEPGAIAGAVSAPGVALSALPRGVARQLEPALAAAGWAVVSNASAYRDDPAVPLVIPEVNAAHLDVLGDQVLVTNPNCTAIPVAMTLAPLHRTVGVEAVCVASYQAVSGAGYPGESAYDMIGNVRPHPGDEEQKLATEVAKILGTVEGGRIRAAELTVSARCVRAPVVDGHLVAVQVRTREPIAPQDAIELWKGWRAPVDLPTGVEHPVWVREERDRPQPRIDAGAGDGMAITVGRVEPCPVMGLKFFAIAHNTVRGAAGAAILNVELLQHRGLVAAD